MTDDVDVQRKDLIRRRNRRDTSGVTSMYAMFAEGPGPLTDMGNWRVDKVTTMERHVLLGLGL